MEPIVEQFSVISRVLYAVAHTISDTQYREKVKEYALLIMESFCKKDLSRMREQVGMVELLLKNAAGLHFIAEENYDVLSRELGIFLGRCETYIYKQERFTGQDALAIFPESSVFPKNSYSGADIPTQEKSTTSQERAAVHHGTHEHKSGSASTPTHASLTMRQETILSLLHKKESVRLMDILVHFPEFNEKTIRNDLRTLCEQGRAIRIGNGGRGSKYQAQS
ncbi:MAG: DeoR family transcriptional regulator [Patescibacteria group bacterium]|nr:DeoR family transcriptional regulator [Patescibacteria group bacterium]MDE2438537.1 DeoR family transcriptional regulator [Patescibacteria group bacterium]